MFKSTITRQKCGQIYIMSDDNFSLICEFCEQDFFTLEDFRVHLKGHIPRSTVSIKIEDASDSEDCEPITPEKIANLKDNFIDILQDYVGSQSSATNRSERSDSSQSGKTYERERNEHPLKRFQALQSNSGNESESTTETTVNHLIHSTRHHKRLRKDIVKSSHPVSIVLSEEIQTDDNGTDYSSDQNTVELHQYSISETLEYEQLRSRKGNFNCRFCRKIFRSNRGRNDHENTHTGERPHHCSICNQSFARYANFWSHSKTHTD